MRRRDYWGVDENSIIFVADPNFGNILNFNVGSNVDLQVPPNFWTRLTSTLPPSLLPLMLPSWCNQTHLAASC